MGKGEMAIKKVYDNQKYLSEVSLSPDGVRDLVPRDEGKGR
jgi:hypothetical protein